VSQKLSEQREILQSFAKIKWCSVFASLCAIFSGPLCIRDVEHIALLFVSLVAVHITSVCRAHEDVCWLLLFIHLATDSCVKCDVQSYLYTRMNSSGGRSSNANASFMDCHRSRSQYESLASLTVLHHSIRGWSPLASVSSSNSVASYIWKARANNSALKPRSQARYGYRISKSVSLCLKKAGMVFIAGKSVWSTPERFKVVCTPCKALYKCSALSHRTDPIHYS